MSWSVLFSACPRHEVNGSIGTGPLHVIRVSLRPLEVQILRRASSQEKTASLQITLTPALSHRMGEGWGEGKVAVN